MGFSWTQDISVGASIDAAAITEIRTNVDTVDDEKCPADKVDYDNDYKDGDDSPHYPGYDSNEHGTYKSGDNPGYDATNNPGYQNDYHSSYQDAKKYGVNDPHF